MTELMHWNQYIFVGIYELMTTSVMLKEIVPLVLIYFASLYSIYTKLNNFATKNH